MPRFRAFLADKVGASIETENQAAGIIRHVCGVKSRGELNTNARAAANYHALVRLFNDWLNQSNHEKKS
ncbi:hypothetical protein BCT27_12600 [Enterovibrio norvegicus]|nr:hypothetical protein BCT27_12600 [Enterovibrio norvegicus]